MRRSTLLGRPLGRSGAIVRVLLARSLWTLVPAAIVGLAPTAADAQTATTGVITGTVTDNQTKRPMPDVVVEVSGSTGEQVVVTDSIPVPPSKHLPNLTVLSVAPLLADAIKRIHLNESVSKLFE